MRNGLREALDKFQRHQPRLTPRFLESLDLPNMGDLSRSELIVNEIKRIVESTVDSGYYPEMKSGPAYKNPLIRAFIEQWHVEENEHSKALDLVRQYATPLGADIRIRPLAYRPTSQHWYKLLGKRASIALQMTWGAANESVTYAVYKRMADKTRNETYAKLLTEGIAPEELHHRAFYYAAAKHYLADDRYTQYVVAKVFKYKWHGVGTDIVSPEDLNFLTHYLFEGEERWFEQQVGEYIRMLPGMHNFSGTGPILRDAGLKPAYT